MKDFQVLILGSRGTVAHEGSNYSSYGGATACVYLNVAGEIIVLDGGSGILSLPSVLQGNKDIHLFISHMHIDHIVGIMACPIFFDASYNITVYGVERFGKDVKTRLDSAMSPPLWPVNSDAFLANVKFVTCVEEFYIGDVKIDFMEGSHPGGCTVYRISHGEKSLVYATDYEITQQSSQRLEQFAKDCTLLLCDGQYTKDEVEFKVGYGHSCWEQAAELAIKSGAKQLGIIHHDPYRTDEMLYNMQKQLKEKFANGFFAHRREEKIL